MIEKVGYFTLKTLNNSLGFDIPSHENESLFLTNVIIGNYKL